MAVCAALTLPTVRLPNARDAGVSTGCGAGGAVATPFRLTVCVAPGLAAFKLLSVSASDPVMVPAVTGVKVASSAQLLPWPRAPAEEETVSIGHAPPSPV